MKLDSGRKKSGGGKYRLDGRLTHGDIKKVIAKKHSKTIGETIVPENIILEISEMAEATGWYVGRKKSDRQMRDIIHQKTSQNSRSGEAAFHIETFDVSSGTISYGTPVESWGNQHFRWTVTNTFQADLQKYETGVKSAHSNKKKPHHAKRGSKPKP